MLLRATLPNPRPALRPGLFARVELVLNEKDNAIQIPEQAIVPQGGRQLVFKVEDGKAKMVQVKTGIRREGMVEIARPASQPEDEVVVAGQIKIRDGALVQHAAARPRPEPREHGHGPVRSSRSAGRCWPR